MNPRSCPASQWRAFDGDSGRAYVADILLLLVLASTPAVRRWRRSGCTLGRRSRRRNGEGRQRWW